jgi:hypothetical protein
VPIPLDNPKTVVWSHSDRQADFYELPTDGEAMHQALGWLLGHYAAVKLWIGLESEDGAELFLTCAPSRREAVVERLQEFEDEFSVFESESVNSAVSSRD